MNPFINASFLPKTTTAILISIALSACGNNKSLILDPSLPAEQTSVSGSSQPGSTNNASGSAAQSPGESENAASAGSEGNTPTSAASPQASNVPDTSTLASPEASASPSADASPQSNASPQASATPDASLAPSSSPVASADPIQPEATTPPNSQFTGDVNVIEFDGRMVNITNNNQITNNNSSNQNNSTVTSHSGIFGFLNSLVGPAAIIPRGEGSIRDTAPNTAPISTIAPPTASPVASSTPQENTSTIAAPSAVPAAETAASSPQAQPNAVASASPVPQATSTDNNQLQLTCGSQASLMYPASVLTARPLSSAEMSHIRAVTPYRLGQVPTADGVRRRTVEMRLFNYNEYSAIRNNTQAIIQDGMQVFKFEIPLPVRQALTHIDDAELTFRYTKMLRRRDPNTVYHEMLCLMNERLCFGDVRTDSRVLNQSFWNAPSSLPRAQMVASGSRIFNDTLGTLVQSHFRRRDRSRFASADLTFSLRDLIQGSQDRAGQVYNVTDIFYRNDNHVRLSSNGTPIKTLYFLAGDDSFITDARLSYRVCLRMGQ